MNRNHLRPLVISTTVLAAGIAASLAGNLQAINLTSATPGIGAYVSATWWPLALFGVIEIMLHTPWLRNWRDGLTKLVAVGLVGAMAAYISYFHLAHTLSAYGYDVPSRYMGPLAIDAAMAMATLSLNRVGHARRAVDTPPVATVATQVDTWTESDTNWLTRIGADLDSTTTPAVPLDGLDASAGSNVVKVDSVPAHAADMILNWGGEGTKGAFDASVATRFNVTPRTARRWRYAVTGAPVSGLPAS